MLSTQKRLNIVIGQGLMHSQSPLLHNTIYKMENINAVMVAKSHHNLYLLLQFIKTFSVQLSAVTMPYKVEILDHLDELSPAAASLKAVNTLINQEGKLYGHNTDIDGIAFALKDIPLAGKSILIIGAGGAARALGYFLHKKNAKLYWFNRTPKNAQALANIFGGEVVEGLPPAKELDIFINSTPIGMYPNRDDSPIPNYRFAKHHIVFDMVYNPRHTQLLQQAKKYGAETISGLDMFIGQGIKQIELFTQRSLHTQSMVEPLKILLDKNQRKIL